MEKGFFFNRVGIHRTRVAIGKAVQFALEVDFGSTYAPVSRSQNTAVRANAANNFIVLKLFIKKALVGPFPKLFGRIVFEHSAADISGGGLACSSG